MKVPSYIIKNNLIQTDLIREVYLQRLESLNFEDLDLTNNATQRALAELMIYSLPPYHDIPTRIKGKLCAPSGSCNRLEENANIIERETFYPDSTFFSHRAKPKCKKCGSTRAQKNGICYRCAAPEEQTSREERKQSAAFNHQGLSTPTEWTSPKKMLLAREIGCLKCGRKLSCTQDEIWTGPEIPFHEGLCDDCYPEPGIWSTTCSDSPAEKPSDCCLKCGFSDQPYALWGMCTSCYEDWQSIHLLETLVGAEKLLIKPGSSLRNIFFQGQVIKRTKMPKGLMEELIREQLRSNICKPIDK